MQVGEGNAASLFREEGQQGSILTQLAFLPLVREVAQNEHCDWKQFFPLPAMTLLITSLLRKYLLTMAEI